DDTLSFDQHVDIVCRSANFYLRALRHIRKHISEVTAKTIACSMIDGRLDYCNSVLYQTSAANINKLQRVLHALGQHRVVSTISPALAWLHWLPIKYRIQFNCHNIQGADLTRAELFCLNSSGSTFRHVNCGPA